MTSPSRRHLAGVALVSATLLMTELALTRIFSVVMYYHFAFLAISIALFGVSASGVFAYVMRARLERHATDDLLSRAVAALCRLHDRRAVLAGAPARRPELFAAQSGADAHHLRARRAPLLRGRPGRDARHLAAVGADQRGLRGGSDRRRRRLPDPHSAPRSARRAGRGARRRGADDRGRHPVRAGRQPIRDRRRRRRHSADPDRRPMVRPRRLRRRRHQGAPGRSGAVQQVEFVLANRRLRADARRLVPEPGLYRPAAGHALHGHRLGRLDADPASESGPVERPVPALRADGAGVPHRWDEGLGAGASRLALYPAPSCSRFHRAGDRTGRRPRSRVRAGVRRGAGRRRRDQPDHRRRRDARSVPRLFRRHLHQSAGAASRWTMGAASCGGRRRRTT